MTCAARHRQYPHLLSPPSPLKPAEANRKCLARIEADKLTLSDDVTIHGSLEIALARPTLQIHRRIQRVQLEEVAMRFARRWARSTVAAFLEVVHTLQHGASQVRRALSDSSRISRHVVDDPVH